MQTNIALEWIVNLLARVSLVRDALTRLLVRVVRERLRSRTLTFWRE